MTIAVAVPEMCSGSASLLEKGKAETLRPCCEDIGNAGPQR
jgi:hypothetical protein